jgi:hypothetical protein
VGRFNSFTAVYEALADGVSESRIWAGIHFRRDLDAGNALGGAVAGRVIHYAQADGSSAMMMEQ